jgi:hypothetical protein
MPASRGTPGCRDITEIVVDEACRMLRLPTIRTQFPDLAEAAAREFLAELLMAECDDRARRRSEWESGKNRGRDYAAAGPSNARCLLGGC